MNQTKRVTVLDPIVKNIIYENPLEIPKKKVAAYARVSTEQDEQQSSYEAQVEYYTKYIKNNPGWEFAGIYADEGISGTNTKKRDGFKSMIADAKAGKINLILTKSISRFARNTVDTLQTVRDLKAIGVEVIFEKENIRTMDKQCEVLLTIMSSLAQEESRSISENVRWGQQRSMQEGNVAMAYGRFLGYRKGEDGKPEIIPEEAEIIKDIYRLFLDGMAIRNIARYLTDKKIPTPAGKEVWSVSTTPAGKEVWSVSTIKSILKNEKYKGDALRQKTFTVDYLTKTVKKNQGEYKQYYIQNSHPAIIDEDTWELVQLELAKRGKEAKSFRDNSPFCNKIVCADCGAYFGHKVFHGKEACRKDVWYCNHRYDGDGPCKTPIVKEMDIKNAYLSALGQILGRKAACLAACRAKLAELDNLSEIKENRHKAEETLQDQLSAIQDLVHENARKSQDQTKYRAKYNKLVEAIEKQKELIADLKSQELNSIAMREKLRRFMKAIESCTEEATFIPEVWNDTVERAVVNEDNTICFEMKDGENINIEI